MGMGLAEIRALEPRPESPPHGVGLCRHLLFAPPRSQYSRSRRRWARSIRPSGKARRSMSDLVYSPEMTRKAVEILKRLGTPCLIHQPSYSMLNRWVETELLDVLGGTRNGMHRLLAARTGHAHDEVSQRRAGRLARDPRRLPAREFPRARHACAHQRPEPDRPAAGPVPGSDGASRGCCATRASRQR